MTKRLLVIFAFLWMFSSFQKPVIACYWDKDTLWQEHKDFPGLLHLAFGKFLHHSKSFYQWRLKDRLKKLQGSPDNLALYDDLAVAYDKLGMHYKAIRVMWKKNRKKPGLYKTYANLGTFYIHNKQFRKGLRYLKKAIQINPKAHFGREIIQQHLVEYVLFTIQKNKGRFRLPLLDYGSHKNRGKEFRFWRKVTFRDFLKKIYPKEDEKALMKRAIKGVLGMLRFGNFRSPVLLEALASLLQRNLERYQGLRSLLLLLARDSAPLASKKHYLYLAKEALSASQSTYFFHLIRQVQKLSRIEMQTWIKVIHKAEKQWLKSEKHPEEKIQQFYLQKVRKEGVFPTTSLFLYALFVEHLPSYSEHFLSFRSLPPKRLRQLWKQQMERSLPHYRKKSKKIAHTLVTLSFHYRRAVAPFQWLKAKQPALANKVFRELLDIGMTSQEPKHRRKRALLLLAAFSITNTTVQLPNEIFQLAKQKDFLFHTAYLFAFHQHSNPEFTKTVLRRIHRYRRRLVRRPSKETWKQLIIILSRLSPKNSMRWFLVGKKKSWSWSIQKLLMQEVVRRQQYNPTTLRFLKKRLHRPFALKALWSWKSPSKKQLFIELYKKNPVPMRRYILNFLIEARSNTKHKLAQEIYQQGSYQTKKYILRKIFHLTNNKQRRFIEKSRETRKKIKKIIASIKTKKQKKKQLELKEQQDFLREITTAFYQQKKSYKELYNIVKWGLQEKKGSLSWWANKADRLWKKKPLVHNP